MLRELFALALFLTFSAPQIVLNSRLWPDL
jgi:hypothetical protein